jgi:hypothetical protein
MWPFTITKSKNYKMAEFPLPDGTGLCVIFETEDEIKEGARQAREQARQWARKAFPEAFKGLPK